MANISITSTATRVDVNFGNYCYAPQVNAKTSSYQRANINEVWIGCDENYVGVKMASQMDWKLGIVQEPDNFVIDSVNGVVPTSIQHLYDLVKELM